MALLDRVDRGDDLARHQRVGAVESQHRYRRRSRGVPQLDAVGCAESPGTPEREFERRQQGRRRRGEGHSDGSRAARGPARYGTAPQQDRKDGSGRAGGVPKRKRTPTSDRASEPEHTDAHGKQHDAEHGNDGMSHTRPRRRYRNRRGQRRDAEGGADDGGGADAQVHPASSLE